MKCADQADSIDVFSLGGVFYYLLSDGHRPWYYISGYQNGVKKWLNKEKPRLPNLGDYEKYGDKVVEFMSLRANHTAFVALKEVMYKCFEYEPKDRPSSFEVVQMLEAKWKEMSVDSAKKKNGRLMKRLH